MKKILDHPGVPVYILRKNFDGQLAGEFEGRHVICDRSSLLRFDDGRHCMEYLLEFTSVELAKAAYERLRNTAAIGGFEVVQKHCGIGPWHANNYQAECVSVVVGDEINVTNMV